MLVVEDDRDYAAVVVQMLLNNPELALDVEHVTSMQKADTYLDGPDGDVDVVLLDLNLPDEQGLRTIHRILKRAPGAAVVVMTALREQSLAVEAIQMGAQEYVVKDDMTPQLLLRTLRYGYERRELVDRLREAERVGQRERELRRLERMAASHDRSTQTSRMYGDTSVRTHLADRYDELVEEYRRLLDTAVDERAYKAGNPLDDDIRSLAGVLGVLRARPRDVIELHRDAIRTRERQGQPELGQAYVEEGRMLLLQVMGYLAAYYRSRAVTGRRGAVPDGGKEAT